MANHAIVGNRPQGDQEYPCSTGFIEASGQVTATFIRASYSQRTESGAPTVNLDAQRAVGAAVPQCVACCRGGSC